MLKNSTITPSLIANGGATSTPSLIANGGATSTPSLSLLQSAIPVISSSSVCDSLNDKIDQLIESLKENECDEIAKMKCAINKNTDRLEDLACAVGGGCNDIKKELIKYEKLYEKIFSAIDNYLIYFREGDFESLSSELTAEYLQEIGLAIASDQLYELDCDESLKCYVHDKLMFSKYRSNAHKIIDGLSRGILLHNEIVSKEECCKRADELNELLNNPTELAEYIKNKFRNFTLVDANVSTIIEPVIKVQYQRYIEKYGFPDKMIFESEKMASIYQELVEEGLITVEDYDNYLSCSTETESETDCTVNVVCDVEADCNLEDYNCELETVCSDRNYDSAGIEGDIDDSSSVGTTSCSDILDFELEPVENNNKDNID